MKISKKWTAGVEAPEEFEAKLKEQKPLFQRLYAILNEKTSANYKQNIRADKYEIPNWSERQADSIGYARALEEVKQLLAFTKD